jgi:trimethylamine--corrinoid protein Co-methyltransferase
MNPTIVQPHLNVLSEEQLEQIHAFSTQLLVQVGIRVDSPKALQFFKSSGSVLLKDNLVKISPELVEWAVKTTPHQFDIYDRNRNIAFRAGDGNVKFGVGVTNLYYQDPLTDNLTGFKREHMAIGTRLAHNLPAFDLVSTIGVTGDVAPGISDLVGILEMTANTTKPIIILNSDSRQYDHSLDLLEHLYGNLQAQPFVIPYFNPVTPLIINKETGDKIISTIQRGLPLIYSNYSMAGTTTPITAAGTLVVLVAELLAGLVLCQLVRENTPVILGSLPAFFDMKTLTDFYDPKTILLNAACAEIMAYYKIPHAGTSGSGLGAGTDLPAAGLHWLNHITTAIGKTGLVPFIGGSLGSKAFSPSIVVYANDIIQQVKYFSAGFVLSQETVNIDEIAAVGPGGNFLLSKSTRKNFRDAYYSNGLFPRISLEKWEDQGHPFANNILKSETIRLIKEGKPPSDHDDIILNGEKFIHHIQK